MSINVQASSVSVSVTDGIATITATTEIDLSALVSAPQPPPEPDPEPEPPIEPEPPVEPVPEPEPPVEPEPPTEPDPEPPAPDPEPEPPAPDPDPEPEPPSPEPPPVVEPPAPEPPAPEPPPPEPEPPADDKVRGPKKPHPHAVLMVAARYDDGVGAAHSHGAVTFPAGWYTRTMYHTNLGTLTTLDGAEVASAVTLPVQAEYEDDSLRVAHVQADLEPGALYWFRTDLERSLPAPALETITRAWMLRPRLVCVARAEHACASGVAFLPLMPLQDMPEGAFRTYLTDDFATAQRWAGTNIGTANYESHHVFVCAFAAGDADGWTIPDHLVRAQRGFAFLSGDPPEWDIQSSGLPWYVIGANATGLDADPEGLAMTPDSGWNLNEAGSGIAFGCLTMHYLTGWSYAGNYLWFIGAPRFSAPGSNTRSQWGVEGTQSTSYGPRFATRANTAIPAFAALVPHNVPVSMIYHPAPGPFSRELTVAAVRNRYAGFEKVSTHNPDSYKVGVWGWNHDQPAGGDVAGDGSEQGDMPLFQVFNAFPYLYTMARHIAADPLAERALDRMAAWCDAQVRGPRFSPYAKKDIYPSPYGMRNPAVYGVSETGPQNGFLSCMALMPLAYHYARTTDEQERQRLAVKLDTIASASHWVYSDAGGQRIDWKGFGQAFFGAHAAAAIRYGAAPGSDAGSA